MDTYKDAVLLNDLWAGGDAPWKVWALRAGVTGASGLVGRHLVAGARASARAATRSSTLARRPTSSSTSPRRRSSRAAREDPVATFEANVALAWRTCSPARAARRSCRLDRPGLRPAAAGADARGRAARARRARTRRARRPPTCSPAHAAGRRRRAARQRLRPRRPRTTTRLVPGTIAARARRARAGDPRATASAARDLLYVDDAVAALLALADARRGGRGLQRRHRRRRTRVREVVDAVAARRRAATLEPEVLGGGAAGEGGQRALDIDEAARGDRLGAARSTSRRGCAGRWEARVTPRSRSSSPRTRGRCGCAGCSTRSRSRRSRASVRGRRRARRRLRRPCVVATHPLGAREHRASAPCGPAAQRNAAWRAATAPLVAFTDDDCRPPAEWLERALGRRRAPGAIVQGATRPDPDEAGLLRAPHRADGERSTRRRSQAQTCNIVYPRAVLERLGGFDEDGLPRRAAARTPTSPGAPARPASRTSARPRS